MLLASARVVGVGPFEDLTFRFTDDAGRARSVAVISGGAGVGKTSLLAAIVATRPGHAVALSRSAARVSFAVTEWLLGDDDPARPHASVVASPGAALDEPEAESLVRRREQALFDRRANEAGFVLVAFSGTRWFSRGGVALASPDATLGRHNARAFTSLEDAARADLARDTKSALAYADVAAALSSRHPSSSPDTARALALGRAMSRAVGDLTKLAGYSYVGADPLSLEPIFAGPGDARRRFDELPTSARHLAAFAALTVRSLYAAYPARDPLEAEGVVLIDDVELRLDRATCAALPGALRAALPRVQWILTTSSRAIAEACDPREVLALRQMPASAEVELFAGDLAVLH